MKIAKKSKDASSPLLPCGRPVPADTEHHEREHLPLSEMTERLKAYVAEKNLNRSEARFRILEVIAEQPSHFSAQDLVDLIQKRFPDVGRSTVYRNLPIFVESGLIQEGPPKSDGQALYELSHEDHHDHIVCLDCQRIFEFHDDALEKRQDIASEKLSFIPRAHRHVIYGSCEFLNRQKDKPQKRAR